MEKRIYLELDGERNFVQRDPSFMSLHKTAKFSDISSDIKEFLRKNKPRDGYGYLLIAAMGDDNWGHNRNKDLFPEEGLSHDGDEWGYKTYMNGGKWFRKHRNKDKDESYGDVVFSYFNPRMHRIEVIVEYDIEKDDWTAEALDKNENIETSMGTTINYDICNVCHPNWRQFYKVDESDMKILSDTKDEEEVKRIAKKYKLELPFTDRFNSGGGLKGIAKTGNRYCDHIKYQLGKMLPDGRVVVMVNLRPKLFDISFVSVNADKSSFVLAKVAEDKNSDDKSSEIKKEVPSEILSSDKDEVTDYLTNIIFPALRAGEESIPNDVLDNMASNNSFEDILSSFLAMGSFPKNREMQRIVLIAEMGKSPEFADTLENKGHIIDDKMIDDMSHLGGDVDLDLGYHRVKDHILNRLIPFADKKSFFSKPVCKRIIMIKKAKDINAFINADYNRFGSGPIPKILITLAAFAGIAKLSGSKSMLKILDGMLKNKAKTMGAVLGASAAAEVAAEIDKEMQRNKQFANQKLSSLGWKGIIGVPAGTYVWGEHIKNKARRGKQISLPEEAVARYPLGSSVAMILAANALMKGKPGMMAKKLFSKTGQQKMAEEIGFEGLNIDDYPLSKHAEIIVGLFDALGAKCMPYVKIS